MSEIRSKIRINLDSGFTPGEMRVKTIRPKGQDTPPRSEDG